MIKRNKLGQFVKGNKGYWTGKKRSVETIKKISKNRKGKCLKNDNPNWKGGKHKEHNRWFVLIPEHPFALKNGYVKQSRLVAEKCLGRYLTRKEVIHHINGIRDDDRPENLYLFRTTGKHSKYHGNQYTKNKLKLKSNLHH